MRRIGPIFENLIRYVAYNVRAIYHPEYSGPECYDPLEAALYDKAGERVMQAAAVAASEASGRQISLYKNNSDGKGNSYGAHENYLLSRETPFGEVIRYAMTFMVTRQIFTGAGKIGLPGDTAC